MTPYLAIRIDVDTYPGLMLGLPGLLTDLKKAGIRATVFLPTGPDMSGLAIARLLTSPSGLRQMIRLRPGGRHLLHISLAGILSPARHMISGILRLRDHLVPHEIALHGHDHWRWIHNVNRWSSSRARTEIDRGLRSMNAAFGSKPSGFGAPGWCTTESVLTALDAFEFLFSSDCRGVHPFFPQAHRTVQIPTTMPTLEDVVRENNMSPKDFIATLDRHMNGNHFHCYCLHTETEGLRFPEFLPRLIEWAHQRGLRIGPLSDALDHIDTIPTGRIITAPRAGRIDAIGCQAPP